MRHVGMACEQLRKTIIGNLTNRNDVFVEVLRQLPESDRLVELFVYGDKLFAWREGCGWWTQVKTPATVLDCGEGQTVIRMVSNARPKWFNYEAIFNRDKGQTLGLVDLPMLSFNKGRRIAEVLFGLKDVKIIDNF
eukprot:GHVS01002900.1.p2 GENE.GHVS01002900.1~~GHVS01002900.1.p2  ORF type:complete len:136 (+),score=12.92 GHVS01002900.1:757-1164(+)